MDVAGGTSHKSLHNPSHQKIMSRPEAFLPQSPLDQWPWPLARIQCHGQSCSGPNAKEPIGVQQHLRFFEGFQLNRNDRLQNPKKLQHLFIFGTFLLSFDILSFRARKRRDSHNFWPGDNWLVPLGPSNSSGVGTVFFLNHFFSDILGIMVEKIAISYFL